LCGSYAGCTKKEQKTAEHSQSSGFLKLLGRALKRLSFDSSFFVLAFELFDTASSINDFMLAGEEWVRRTCGLDDD
jgi:hypothetical protein